MKFFFPLFLLPFLCVKCCPWDDCEGADFLCDEFLPVLPQLVTAIPYQDGETLRFRFEDDPEIFSVAAFRNEGLIGSQQCQDEIFTVLQATDSSRPFRITISTDTNGESLLNFVFSFDPPNQESLEFYRLEFNELGVSGVMPPLELRVVTDTVLAGVDYQDVGIISVPEATEPGKISAFYYNEAGGLLRVERIGAPSFFRIN
ncbi:MAG: hypothetical protein AB8H12_18985 [Lewinella sp.]